jgi:hypothetical protein
MIDATMTARRAAKRSKSTPEPLGTAVLRKTRRVAKVARRLALNALQGGRPETASSPSWGLNVPAHGCPWLHWKARSNSSSS